MNEQYPVFSTETKEPKDFGHGWISGAFSTFLGILGLLAVLCLLWPSIFSVHELRAFYHANVQVVRVLIHIALISAFVLGLISVVLRRNKILGSIGMACVLIAVLLGGSQAPVHGSLQSPAYLGLDWFIISLIFYSIVFVPIER